MRHSTKCTTVSIKTEVRGGQARYESRERSHSKMKKRMVKEIYSTNYKRYYDDITRYLLMRKMEYSATVGKTHYMKIYSYDRSVMLTDKDRHKTTDDDEFHDRNKPVFDGICV